MAHSTYVKDWECERPQDSQSSPAHPFPSTWRPLHRIHQYNQHRMWTDPIHSRQKYVATASSSSRNPSSKLQNGRAYIDVIDTASVSPRSPPPTHQTSSKPVHSTRSYQHTYYHSSYNKNGSSSAAVGPLVSSPPPRAPTTATEAMAAAVAREAAEEGGVAIRPLPLAVMTRLENQPPRLQRMHQLALQPNLVSPVVTSDIDGSDLGPYMIPQPMDMAPKLLTLDDYNLMSLGYKPVLARKLSGLSLTGAAVAAANVLTGILPLYGEALMNGGPAWATWSYFVMGIMAIIVNLSLSELASAYPTTASVHHWVYQLGSSRRRAFLTWMTGWLSIISAISVTSSVAYYFSKILGQLLLTNYGTSMTSAMVVMFYLGVLLLWGFLNILPISVAPLLFSSSGILHLGLTVTVASVLFSLTKVDPELKDVPFTATINYSGMSSSIYAALSTLLMSSFVFQTNDTAVRYSEESKRPERALPRAMISTAALSLLVGFPLIVALNYGALRPIDGLLDEPVPAAKIIMDAVGSQARSTVMGFILAAFFFTGLSRLSVATRVAYSLARDGGLPKSAYWSHLHPRRQVPQRLAWLVLGASASCIFPFFWGNTQAYDWIGSTAIIATNLNYALPLLMRLTREGQVHYIPGPFTLGRFSKPLSAVSLLWLLGTTTIIMFPRSFPLTKENFNYSSIAILGMLLLISLSWFNARTDFTGGPKRDNRASHRIDPGSNNNKKPEDDVRRGVSSKIDSFTSVQHRNSTPKHNANQPVELVNLETLHRLRAKATRKPTPPLLDAMAEAAATANSAKPVLSLLSGETMGRSLKQTKQSLVKSAQNGARRREGVFKPPPLDMVGVTDKREGEPVTGLSTAESGRSLATSSILGIPLSDSPEMMHQELPVVRPSPSSLDYTFAETSDFEHGYDEEDEDEDSAFRQRDSLLRHKEPPPATSKELEDDYHDLYVVITHSLPTTSSSDMVETDDSTSISSTPALPPPTASKAMVLTKPRPLKLNRKIRGNADNTSPDPSPPSSPSHFNQPIPTIPVIPLIEIAPATTISSHESRSLATDSGSSTGMGIQGDSVGTYAYADTTPATNWPVALTAPSKANDSDSAVAASPLQQRQRQRERTTTTTLPISNSLQSPSPKPHTRSISHNTRSYGHSTSRREREGGPHPPGATDVQEEESEDEYRYTLAIGRRSKRTQAVLESIRRIQLPGNNSGAALRAGPSPFQSRIPRLVKSSSSPVSLIRSTGHGGFRSLFGSTGTGALRPVKGRIPTPYPGSLVDNDESSVPATPSRTSLSIDDIRQPRPLQQPLQEQDLRPSTLPSPSPQPQVVTTNSGTEPFLTLPVATSTNKRHRVNQDENSHVIPKSGHVVESLEVGGQAPLPSVSIPFLSAATVSAIMPPPYLAPSASESSLGVNGSSAPATAGSMASMLSSLPEQLPLSRTSTMQGIPADPNEDEDKEQKVLQREQQRQELMALQQQMWNQQQRQQREQREQQERSQQQSRQLKERKNKEKQGASMTSPRERRGKDKSSLLRINTDLAKKSLKQSSVRSQPPPLNPPSTNPVTSTPFATQKSRGQRQRPVEGPTATIPSFSSTVTKQAASDSRPRSPISALKLDRYNREKNDPQAPKNAMSSTSFLPLARFTRSPGPPSLHQPHSQQGYSQPNRSKQRPHNPHLTRGQPPQSKEQSDPYRAAHETDIQDSCRNRPRPQVPEPYFDNEDQSSPEGESEEEEEATQDELRGKKEEEEERGAMSSVLTATELLALKDERDMYRQKRRTVADWAREQSRIQEKRERRRARARAIRAAAAFAAVRQRLESQSSMSRTSLSPPVAAAVAASTAAAAAAGNGGSGGDGVRSRTITVAAARMAGKGRPRDSASSLDNSSVSSKSEEQDLIKSPLQHDRRLLSRYPQQPLHRPHHRHRPPSQRQQQHHHQQQQQQQQPLQHRSQQSQQPQPRKQPHNRQEEQPKGEKEEGNQEREQGEVTTHRLVLSPASNDAFPPTMHIGTPTTPSSVYTPTSFLTGQDAESPNVGGHPEHTIKQERQELGSERRQKMDMHDQQEIEDLYGSMLYESDLSGTGSHPISLHGPPGSYSLDDQYQPSIDTESLGAGVGRA